MRTGKIALCLYLFKISVLETDSCSCDQDVQDDRDVGHMLLHYHSYDEFRRTHRRTGFRNLWDSQHACQNTQNHEVHLDNAASRTI